MSLAPQNDTKLLVAKMSDAIIFLYIFVVPVPSGAGRKLEGEIGTICFPLANVLPPTIRFVISYVFARTLIDFKNWQEKLGKRII